MMQLSTNYYFILSIALLSSWTSQLKVDKVLPDASSSDSSDLASSNSNKLRDDQMPRNKRAIGLLLQGLVQALGYNTTPIQISSIANVNNNGASSTGPRNIDTIIVDQSSIKVKNPAVNISAPMPRQRETLKFTGVVNFGNNTNLLSHLRQYEILFHSAPTIPPATMNAASSSSTITPNAATSNPCAPTISLPIPMPSQPYLVPIPIPLMQDIQYPKPLLSVVTAPFKNIHPTSDSAHLPENDTIQNDGNGDSEESYDDESDVHQNNYQDADDYNDGSTQDIKQHDNGDIMNDDSADDERNIKIIAKDFDEYSPIKEPKISSLRENSKLKTPKVDLRKGQSPFKYTSEYMPNSYVSNSDGFGEKLPIDNEPFHGQLMNSYGESLEHSGKIDESVADYFARFKNPQTGIFEQPKIDVFPDYEKKLTSIERYLRQPLAVKRTQQKHSDSPHVGFKYEEYKLNNSKKSDELRTPSFTKTGGENRLLQNDEQYKTHRTIVRIPNDHSRSNDFTKNFVNYEIKMSHDKASTVERIPNRPFDILKFNPYYKPIQYVFTPELSESTSQKITSYPIYMKNFTRIDENLLNSREKNLMPRTRHFNMNYQAPLLRNAPMPTDYIRDNRKSTMQPIKDMMPIEY